MKVKEKSLSENFSPLCLFIDDLYSIEKILKKDNTTITIETVDHTFSSISELKEQYDKQNLASLEIKTSEPYISINLSSSSAYVYCSKDDDTSVGILYKIKNQLKKSERNPGLLYSFWPLLIGLNGFFFIGSIPKIESLLPKISWIFLGITVFSWYTYASYINLKKYCEIKIIKRSEEKNFFIEKKHDLILVIIGAILGALFSKLFK